MFTAHLQTVSSMPSELCTLSIQWGFHVIWSWISGFSSTSCSPCQRRVNWMKCCTVSSHKRLMPLTQLFSFKAYCTVLFFLLLIWKIKGAMSFGHSPFHQAMFLLHCLLWSLWQHWRGDNLTLYRVPPSQTMACCQKSKLATTIWFWVL